MPLFAAGIDSSDNPRIVEVSVRQMSALGLEEESQLLGCGTQACAYLNDAGDVVKFTQDANDALASWLVMQQPAGSVDWAIPIHDVARLDSDFWVIVAAYAEPVDEQLKRTLDGVVQEMMRVNLGYDQWPAFYEETRADFAAEGDDAGVYALDLIDDAFHGFQRVGFQSLDVHGGNWGMYRGRPVMIDLGLSRSLRQPPVRVLQEVGGLHRRW